MARQPGPDFEIPSLELIRPITHLTVADIAQFEDEVFELADHVGDHAENRAAFRGVRFRDEIDPRITLISGEETARFHEYHGLPLTRGGMGFLKDFIKNMRLRISMNHYRCR